MVRRPRFGKSAAPGNGQGRRHDDAPGQDKEKSGLSKLREELTNTYIATVLAAVIATGTVTAGVVAFFMDNLNESKLQTTAATHAKDLTALEASHIKDLQQIRSKHAGEIQELELQLDAVRKLSGEDQIVHMRDNVIFSANEVDQKIPDVAQEFDKGRFYAIANRASFTKDEVYPHEIMALLNQTDLDEQIVASLREQHQLNSVHFWRSHSEHRITGHPFYKLFFPHFTLYKIAHNSFTQVTGYSDWRSNSIAMNLKRIRELRERAEAGDGVEEYIQALNDEFFSGDPTGYVLINYLYSKLQFANMYQAPFAIRRIHKEPGILYIHLTTTLSEVTVDDQPYNNYYIHEELYAVNTQHGVYLINSFLPSSETILKRSKEWPSMAAWWAAFRVKAYAN